MNTNKIVIKNEDDAFKLLEKLLEGSLKRQEFDIEFEGWPVLSIYIKGKKYDQTITSSCMKGFLEFQKAIHRSYAEVKYKTPNSRSLTKEERECLEILVKVAGGSSDLSLNMQKLAENMVDAGVEKMDGTQITIVAVTALILLAGKSVFNHYITSRRLEREAQLNSEEKSHTLETIKAMSSEETERMKVIAKLIQKEPSLDNINRAAFDARTELLKGLKGAESAEFQGVAVTGEQADILTQNARRQSSEVRMDGYYRITMVDARKIGSFKVKIKDVDSGDEFWAGIDKESTRKDGIRIHLKNAEWGNEHIGLKVIAKDKDGEINSAKIIDILEGKVQDKL
ncbi:MAG: hypothetical protein ACK4L8_10925 [Nitrincola lacisaponensis]|uniref:hypothetical protein n=1 Tax=Nitrincola lacisaponensis TaxID=267850 RepID=UPI00391D3B66